MSDSITLHRYGEQLIIIIGPTRQKGNPTASILNHSGETIERFLLKEGRNIISMVPFEGKSYSIRIINGEDVVVKMF